MTVARHGTAAVVIAAALLYGSAAWMSSPLVGLYHDDGIYIGSALSLARDQSYRIPHLPGAPLQAKYPPFFPALLAPLAAWVGSDPDRLGAFRWPSVCLTLGALALIPGLLRRWGLSPREALAGAALTGVAPLVFQHGLLVLSEAPYMLLSIATLRLLPSQKSDASAARWIATGLCAASAVLSRSIGLALLPALAVAAWPHRRDPRAWIPLTFGALAFLGWSAAAMAMRSVEATRDFGPLYSYYLGYAMWLHPSLGVIAKVAWTNLGEALLACGDATLGWRIQGVAGWQYPSALLGLCATGGWLRLGRRARPEAAYLLATLAMILAFPFDVSRYFAPLTPFVVAGLAIAGRAATARAGVPAAVVPTAAALLFSSCLAVDLAHFPTPESLPVLNRSFSATAFGNGARWLRKHSRPEDVIVSEHDPWIYLATGRRAIPPGVYDPFWQYAEPGAEIDSAVLWEASFGAAREYGARWVFWTKHWHPVFSSLWRSYMRSMNQSFALRFEADGIEIYEILPAAEDAG